MGRATAELFASKGWFVGATDVNELGLKSLEADIGPDNCFISTLDVTSAEDFGAVLEAFSKDTGGTLDLLFNNAGIGNGGFFDEMDFADVMAVVNVNFIGVLRGIHMAYPLLKATPNSLCFTTGECHCTPAEC